MEQLKTYVVPLAHDTLSKDEVAARCIAAAEKKGYEVDDDPYFSYEEAKKWSVPVSHFYAGISSVYNFHNHDCQEQASNTLTTLEAFEEYCRVVTLEQRIAELEQKLDQLAHIVAEKLQEPKEEAKADERVQIEGLFVADEPHSYLCLPDNTLLLYDFDDVSTWVKERLRPTPSPHTLVNVEKHTVGKFYLLKEGDPNDFTGHALCLDNGKFAYAYGVVGTIAVAVIEADQLTLQEVNPLR